MEIEARNISLSPFDKLSYTYVVGSPMNCILIIENLTKQKMYFKIISTLCKQITVKPDNGFIEPNQCTAVELQLVHERNINYSQERIAVISDSKPFLYGYITRSVAEKDILRVEVLEAPEEVNIKPEFIQINESVAFKTKGNQLYKEGNYQGALEKYQQAVVIY